jgi:hypothetical protein
VRAHDGSLDLVCTQQRTDGGLRHLRDGGPGHRGHEGPPVRNASPGAKQPRASGLSAGRHGHTPGLRNKRPGPGPIVKRRLCNVFSDSLWRRPPGPGARR